MYGEFESISEKYEIPGPVLEAIENDISGKGSREVVLTSLQREAIHNGHFWFGDGENRNLIIQGATSSGKTLVAELLALQSVFSCNKHVVYLVPLKALVSEKVQQFKKDVANAHGLKISIFASSSDYQDHDTELAEGQYDIAVVVYEKFFAMLAEQRDNKFLEKCGLIVVDEIQLLASQDRGAKLEYALTKVRNNYSDKIRILGLTTIDCDTTYVEKWLNAVVIKNANRPIALREKIISLSGAYWERYVPGENEVAEQNRDHLMGKIEVEGIEKLKNQKLDLKKNALLNGVLKEIYEKDASTKVIVFASSRGRCRKIAMDIARSGVLEKREVSRELDGQLDKTDDESERSLFKNQLLPAGVAYHSAALPMSLRETIEAEFKSNLGGIKLIVATETLTIGMNLPADVMILYDNQVFRGEEGAVDIKPQEYKNYIGRAGRLGITEKTGESYLFVNSDSDIPFYWKKYVECHIENISSALKDAAARDCAPYYLNLLCKGKDIRFTESTIKDLAGKTLNAFDAREHGRVYDINASEIIKDLKKAELIVETDGDESELDDEDTTPETYKMTNFGEMLAPYALSVITCVRIKNRFRDGEYKARSGIRGGLPLDYTDQELKKGKYLLDILYTVCTMEEVRKVVHPRLPEPNSPQKRVSYQGIEKAILAYLRKYGQEEGEDAFWKNSELRELCNAEEKLGAEELTCILRAILLRHWIKGELPSQMQEKTGLSKAEFYLYTGDMARIGESCSYIVEAISKCFFTNNKREYGKGALEHAFYFLAAQMKYGLSSPNLIRVANRHIYGLTRSTIIKMDEEARKNGFENVNLFIRSSSEKVYGYLTKTQRKDLLQQMSERYEERNVENLIARVIEDEIVDFTQRSDYENIARPRVREAWQESLKEVFLGLDNVKCHKLETGSVDGFRLCWDGKELYTVCVFGQGELLGDQIKNIREKIRRAYDCKVLFVTSRNLDFSDSEIKENDIVISSELLCKVILEILALGGTANGRWVCEYLCSEKGVIVDKGVPDIQRKVSVFIEEDPVEEEALSPYQTYIRRYGYTNVGQVGERQGHASVYKVRDKVGACYAVKEIKVPENEEEYEYLCKRTRETIAKYGDASEANEEVERICDRICEEESIVLDDKEKEEVIGIARKRAAQLSHGVSDKTYYMYQSIVFALEGYKRLREAKIIARIAPSDAKHVVRTHNPDLIRSHYEMPELYEADTKQNVLLTSVYFAMELYEGSVEDRGKRSELLNNKEEVVKIGIHICQALIDCHGKGYIHRDIKPANILYNKGGYYLSDFGCAKEIGKGRTEGVGTMRYMAPEAARGEYSAQSDLYSLGCTLVYLYTGKMPNQIRNADETDRLTGVLLKACEIDVAERMQSAQELRDMLRAL